MIQRIQTVWMLVTVGLVVCGALIDSGPLAVGWAIVLFGIAALVPFVAIFLFKNRSRQTSMLIAEFVLLAGSAGFSIYYSWIAHTAWAYSPLFFFTALLINWLALRGVLRDQMLIRDTERIR